MSGVWGKAPGGGQDVKLKACH